MYLARCPTQTPGSVIISPDYDPNDPGPADLRAALTAVNSQESVPWSDFNVALPSSRLHSDTPRKFTRVVSDNLPSSSKYDAGIVHIASEGVAAVLGHIWVEYSVSLESPQLLPTIASTPSGSTEFRVSSNQTCPSQADPTATSDIQLPFSLSGDSTDTCGVTYDSKTGEFTFQPGTYTIDSLLDYTQPANAQGTTSVYNFLQSYFNIVPAGAAAYNLFGPCNSTSGLNVGTRGTFLSAPQSALLTFSVATVLSVFARFIVSPRDAGAGTPYDGLITPVSNLIIRRLSSDKVV